MSMTVTDPAFRWPEQAPASHSVAAASLVRPLVWLTTLAIAAAGGLFILSRPVELRWLPNSRFPGLHLPGAGLAMASLLLAALGLLACLLMVTARRRDVTPGRATANMTSARRTAGWPQTILTLLFTAAAVGMVLADWPLRQVAADTMMGPGGFTMASALLLLATPWLLAERYIASVTAERLPEAGDLRNLLFLPVFFLGAQAISLIVTTFGFGTLYWVRIGLATFMLLICAELTLRVLATWFLPPPDHATARATIVSFLAGLARGQSLSPAAMTSTVRTQFGLDFSRSWALRFMRSAAAPVVLLMLAFCWFLTGVTRIELNERGAYERFGAVATMLQPGLHLGLPWPFGVVRHVEFGVMHAVLISDGENAMPEAADRSTAEGDAPASANRLWDSEQPGDVSYIIASSEQNRQSFQTVSASVRVLYRIGLHDGDARAALYHEADADALVRSLAGRLLAQFFAARTLPIVLGENQSVVADDVRTQLRQALDRLHSGIDVVAVTVEAIHPPAGAAAAYRNVQAAEIAATTSIATERGRARTTQSVAQRDAHGATDDATAYAAETIGGAQVDLTDVTADDRPYRAAAKPFLLERYFTDVAAALRNVPLEIVDHRLTGSSLPTIDLRPPGMIQDGSDRRPNSSEKMP
jgi:regulator of protease activity HflC (stomatin/prohibitin superfamily)